MYWLLSLIVPHWPLSSLSLSEVAWILIYCSGLHYWCSQCSSWWGRPRPPASTGDPCRSLSPWWWSSLGLRRGTPLGGNAWTTSQISSHISPGAPDLSYRGFFPSPQYRLLHPHYTHTGKSHYSCGSSLLLQAGCRLGSFPCYIPESLWVFFLVIAKLETKIDSEIMESGLPPPALRQSTRKKTANKLFPTRDWDLK